MKTRVTFRIASDLAEVLRDLPNQTRFVEQALREALRAKCPTCDGSGRVATPFLRVSNFRDAALPPLTRETAVRLRELVAFARRAAATSVRLMEAEDQGLRFAIARGDDVMLRGVIQRDATRLFGGGAG